MKLNRAAAEQCPTRSQSSPSPHGAASCKRSSSEDEGAVLGVGGGRSPTLSGLRTRNSVTVWICLSVRTRECSECLIPVPQAGWREAWVGQTQSELRRVGVWAGLDFPRTLTSVPKAHVARRETGAQSCFVKSLTWSHGVKPRQVLCLSHLGAGGGALQGWVF